MLNCRTLVASDLRDSLAICQKSAGAEIVGAVRTLAAWQRLIAARSFAGAVVEADPPIAGSRIVGMGAAVFVNEAFAEHEIAEPEPGLNARIIASIDAACPVILSDDELRCANSNGGLDLVILCAPWRKGVLDPAAQCEMESMLAAAFFRLFAGWRFRRLIREGIDRDTIAHIEAQRIFVMKDGYERFRRRCPDSAWNEDRALFVCSREDALAVPGSVASILFAYREPVLRLREHDQQLLGAALKGLTDQELARTLRLKLPTVKKRWATVFNHVALARPALLPWHESPSAHHVRGPQKRHHLLEYLRSHPEELRPMIPRR